MTIKVAVENRITTISIHRPEARNAVDPATATALFKAFLAFEADGQSDVAILTGDATAFCAGFDLKAAALGMTPDWLAALAIPKGWIELRPVFRTVCLLTLRGHFPSHIFESLFWRFVADA